MCPSYTPGLLKGNVTFPESEDIIAVHVTQVGLRTSSFPDSKHWNSHTHVTLLHNLHEHFFSGFWPQEKPCLTQCCLWGPPFSAAFRSNARDLSRFMHLSWSQARQVVRGAERPPLTGPGQQRTGKMCTRQWESTRGDWSNFLACFSCHTLLSTSITYSCVWQEAELPGAPDLVLFNSYTPQRELFHRNCFTLIIWADINTGNKSQHLFPQGASFKLLQISSPSNSVSTPESDQGGRKNWRHSWVHN